MKKLRIVHGQPIGDSLAKEKKQQQIKDELNEIKSFEDIYQKIEKKLIFLGFPKYYYRNMIEGKKMSELKRNYKFLANLLPCSYQRNASLYDKAFGLS